MSTQIKTKMKDHYVTRFWGGVDRGSCLQITSANYKLCKTASEQMQEPGYIQLTMIDAAHLANALADFVSSEAKRRKRILSNQIDGMKNMEKTVFREISELPDSMFNHCELVVDLVDKFCPISSCGIDHDPSNNKQEPK